MKITWQSHQIELKWSHRVHLLPQVKKEMVSLFTPCFLWKDERIVSNNFENWMERERMFLSWRHLELIINIKITLEMLKFNTRRQMMFWPGLLSVCSLGPRGRPETETVLQMLKKQLWKPTFRKYFHILICDVFKPATCCEANLVSPSRYSKLSRKENSSHWWALADSR